MALKSETYIRSHTLMGIPEFIDHCGGNSAMMLQAFGLPLSGYDETHRVVSHQAVGRLMEFAATELNRPCFALEILLRMPKHFPAVGPIMLLAKFEKNVRGWLKASQHYVKFHSNAFFVEVIEPPESATFRMRYVCDAQSQFSRQYAESTLGVIVAMLRSAIGRPAESPVKVRFQHSNLSVDDTVYERVFGCPIEFDADHTEIIFKSEILEYSTEGNLSFLKSILGLYVRHRLERMPVYQSSTTNTVSLLISSSLSTGHCTVDNVANSMGINTKKLQRLLQEEGTTFSDVLEDVREHTAKSLLTTSNIPISRIAGLLDYAGMPQFTLAFKRWAQKSPQDYRKCFGGIKN